MGALLDDIATTLDTQFAYLSLLDVDRNLFKSTMPDTPTFAVGLWQYAGQPPVRTMGGTGKSKMIRPRVQIRVRNDKFALAMARMNEMRNFLDTIREQVIAGTRYHRVESVGEPFDQGPDSSRRVQIICNFEVWMEN